MKRFTKLRRDTVMWFIINIVIAGFSFAMATGGGDFAPSGFGLVIFFITSLFASLNIVFYIIWRVLEEIENNKENPVVKTDKKNVEYIVKK